jgi:hypothetical protein
MLDDRFEDLLRDSAREYNDPPETPREEMWERIAEARKEEERGNGGTWERGNEGTREGFHRSRVPSFRPFRPYRLIAGIAAILALGIGLGRLSVHRPQPVPTPVGTASESPRVSPAYRLATTEHLGQSEAFLTLFRASVRGHGDERLASATARQLLATNRLLLDSPAATDPRTKLLLQDLELVLAEIAQLAPQPGARDLDLITEGLEKGGVLSRLRTAVPSGANPTPGAL